LEELEKTISYCRNIEGAEINKLIVAGGCAQVPYVSDFFADKLKLPLYDWNPLKKMNLTAEEEKQLIPFCAVVLGLIE